MELGYKNSPELLAPAEFGAWKYCKEDDMRRIVDDNPTKLKLSAMADAERCEYKTDILPCKDSVLDIIRVATYIHQIPTAIDMVKDAHDKGYETGINLMALSTVNDRQLDEALKVMADSPVDVVYIVDSFGAFYGEDVRDLTRTFVEAMKDTGKEVGIHMHNNLQLAFANTIEGLVHGASFLDGTINGLGRGAGNCTLELLLGFLKNPKFHQRPVLEVIEKVFVPLRKELEWGYMIPYMITGQMNEHPRPAIKMRGSDQPDTYVAFFDKMLEEESV